MMHISHINQDLKVGDTVKQGDYLATLCSQGQSGGPHIDFRIHNAGNYSDRFPVSDWFKDLILHESLIEVKTEGTSNPTTDKQGWTNDDALALQNKARFTGAPEIPDVYKIK